MAARLRSLARGVAARLRTAMPGTSPSSLCCDVCRRDRAARVLHAPQPDLPPVGVDATGAEPMVVGLAGDAFEDDAVTREGEHLAGTLVDNPLDPAQHPGALTTVLL